MNYPVWELGFGSGMLIAVVAVLHVFVSHFAVGGGFYLTLTELYAYRKKDAALLEFVKRHTRFFVLMTLVFGAITGVGIWFTMGLISPATTSALIHLFVWFWAIEWIFFLIEITAAIVYYNTWDNVSQKTHGRIGMVYFVSSYMSLVIINGILTFMLTPGDWLETRNLWDGFFNPTYMPSLLARTSICIMMAGLFGLLTGSRTPNPVKRDRIVRYSGIWAFVGIVTAIPAYYWYYQALPIEPVHLFAGVLPTSLLSVEVLIASVLILGALVLIPLLAPRFFRFEMAFILLLFGLGAFGGSEFLRESVRKPWTLYGYMYGNSLRPDEYPEIAEKGGLLPNAIFVKNHQPTAAHTTGEDVFRIACRGCHALDGYKGLRDSFSGMDQQFAQNVVTRVEHMRGNMPPFPGTETEAQALATWLLAQTDSDYVIADGEEVFRKRCIICHTIDDGYRDLYPMLESYPEETLLESLPIIGSWLPEMVPFSGTPKETEMLTRYIRSWYPLDTTQTTGGE